MNVYLVSKTIGVGDYANLSNEEIIAAVARHGVIKNDNGKLVRYLMDHGHWSPLQFIDFTFKIKTKRAISAQIFRHRSLEHQERSTRYDKTLGIEPIEFRLEHPTNRQSSTDAVGLIENGKVNLATYENTDAHRIAIINANKALEAIKQAYEDLLKVGVAKECARDILPLATTTHIHIKGNLRSLLSFLNVRMDKHAQKDIVEIAERIGEAIEKELPNIMGAIDWRNGMFM